jgi:hypothetical protein
MNVELGRILPVRMPTGLVEIPQRVPVVPATAVMMTTGGNRTSGQSHDEGGVVRMVAIPGTGIDDPARAATAPRATRDHREPTIRDPLLKVKRGVPTVP